MQIKINNGFRKTVDVRYDIFFESFTRLKIVEEYFLTRLKILWLPICLQPLKQKKRKQKRKEKKNMQVHQVGNLSNLNNDCVIKQKHELASRESRRHQKACSFIVQVLMLLSFTASDNVRPELRFASIHTCECFNSLNHNCKSIYEHTMNCGLHLLNISDLEQSEAHYAAWNQKDKCLIFLCHQIVQDIDYSNLIKRFNIL